MRLSAFIEVFMREGESIGRGAWRYRGLTRTDGYGLQAFIPEGFELVERWSKEPYRFVWVHDAKRWVLTYCEGNVCLTVHAGEASYLDELEEAAEFYAAERGED